MITAARHGIDVAQLCPNATEAVKRLQDAGYEAYIVGGSVRDLLLGKVPKDFDVATDAAPEEVRVVFPRCRLIGRRFRLAHVRLGGTLVEVATFRATSADEDDDRTHAGGRILRDNVWGSVEEDAVRRDFTINALFMDPVSGEIRDFVGGYDDLQDRRLRLIGDPETRYREDPVRMLRAARFVAKLGVEPDPDTEEPIARMAGSLEQVPPARLFEEVCKLFLTGHAARTLESLQRFGLTLSLFPVLKPKGGSGKAEIGPLLMQAMVNTDERVARDMSVTPAFLYASLLWQPVRDRSQTFMTKGSSEYEALERAAEEVISEQVRRTAIPRRFSAVTRQIWLTQSRFRKTRGAKAKRVLQQPRFRAAYDFLLLRVHEDPDLEPLAEFWTQAQKQEGPAPSRVHGRRGGGASRGSRQRRRKAAGGRG